MPIPGVLRQLLQVAADVHGDHKDSQSAPGRHEKLGIANSLAAEKLGTHWTLEEEEEEDGVDKAI